MCGTRSSGDPDHCIGRCKFWLLFFKKKKTKNNKPCRWLWNCSIFLPSWLWPITHLKLGTRKTEAQDSNYQLKRIYKQYNLASAHPSCILRFTLVSFQIRIYSPTTYKRNFISCTATVFKHNGQCRAVGKYYFLKFQIIAIFMLHIWSLTNVILHSAIILQDVKLCE